MDPKDEIATGLRAVQERFERLAPRIVTKLDAPLPTGTWTVHDALCHVAADSDAVAAWRKRVEALSRGESARPPGFDIDAFNQERIDQRKGLPAAAVVDEVRGHFSADLAAIAVLDDELLAREIDYRDAKAPAARMLLFYTGAHNNGHLDEIERALDA